jgi:hypothetical protein
MTADLAHDRELAHELIDRLSPEQLGAVRGLLEVMAGDDEPITDEDRRRLIEGRAWFAARDGVGIPMEEVLAEAGLTLEDFPAKP